MHLSATKERLPCLSVLVVGRADLEATDQYGLTPLHYATRQGDAIACRQILYLRASPHAKDHHKQTPLHHAVLLGELEVIEVLLAGGLSPNEGDACGCTPLHVAVRDSQLQALDKLLKLGCDRDARTHHQDTPLHMACLLNKPEYCAMLMKAGADVNAAADRGQTPLHVAADAAHDACVLTLLSREHRPEHARADKHAVRLNHTNGMKQTPLHVAAWRGHASTCDLLIQAHAQVDPLDAEQNTPLQLAVRKNCVGVLRTLLRLQADPKRPNAFGLLPLQQACVDGSLEVCKALKELRMDVRLDDVEPWQWPLSLAEFYKNDALIAYLSIAPPIAKLNPAMPRMTDKTVTVSHQSVFMEPQLEQFDLQIKLPSTSWEKAVDTAEDAIMEGRVRSLPIPREQWSQGGQVTCTGLRPNTRYHLRFMAMNRVGKSTGRAIDVVTKAEKKEREAAGHTVVLRNRDSLMRTSMQAVPLAPAASVPQAREHDSKQEPPRQSKDAQSKESPRQSKDVQSKELPQQSKDVQSKESPRQSKDAQSTESPRQSKDVQTQEETT